MSDQPPRRSGAHRAGRSAQWQPSDPRPTTPPPGEVPPGEDPAGLTRWPDQGYPRAPWHRRFLAGPLARGVALSLVAVVLVGAVIAGVWLAYGHGPSDGVAAPAPGLRSTTHSPPPSPTGASPAVTTTPPSTTAATSSAPSTSPSAASHSTPATTTRPTTQAVVPPPPEARPPLLVLNNSRVKGLASDAAADFAHAGWPIAGVGNFTGRVAETTVYYPPGDEAAARELAREFPAIARVHPRFAGLPGHGLTVVVTRHYPH